MDPIAPLFAKALRFLSYRSRSEKEVREYLVGKHRPTKKSFVPPSAEIVDAVVAKLREMRFLNDLEFAESWVRNRTEYKPKAKNIIAMELRQKGIADEIIEKVLQKRSDAKNEKALAVILLAKRKKRYESMGREERQQKAGGFLARKGFAFDDIRSAIDEVFGKGV